MKRSLSNMFRTQETQEELFAPGRPFNQFSLDVGDGHQIYVEESGNPDGIPVVFLHGGPGGGCTPMMRRFFDPLKYHLVLFDQRGCGRSTPHASVQANTTWHLISDIEAIRAYLGLERWVVFGGSWGATLALLYAQSHPNSVDALILRGIFLMTQAELDWFYAGGAGKFWPQQWQKLIAPLSPEERSDVIGAYHKRLFSGKTATENQFALLWAEWESSLASLQNERSISSSVDYARAFARLENHYFYHNGFLKPEQAILKNMDKIKHLPGHIVHGRYDMICPPRAAFDLAEIWGDNATLHIMPLAGHALSEPQISARLVQIMNGLEY